MPVGKFVPVFPGQTNKGILGLLKGSQDAEVWKMCGIILTL
jgi:hypothetical protein